VFRFRILALIAVALLTSQARAAILMYLDEIDDVRVLNAVSDNPRVKAARQALQQVEDELMLLPRAELESLLGKRIVKPAKTYAMPIAEERSILLSGLHDAADHREHTDFIDFYPVGDFAAVQAFYSRQQPDGKPIALRFYLKVDEMFPKLAPDNLDRRLAWEQAQFGRVAKHVSHVLEKRPPQATGLVKLIERLAKHRESCFGDPGIDLVGAGDWSKPVNGLCGRLLIAEGRRLGESKVRETTVYLELQNVSETAGSDINVYGAGPLKWQLLDAHGKPVPPAPSVGSGGRPSAMQAIQASVPYDSAVRLRVNPYGFGSSRAIGFTIPLGESTWNIRAGDTSEYFLSATLTASADRDRSPANAWSGTLDLPAINLSFSADTKSRD
jgi:hypothetical protein